MRKYVGIHRRFAIIGLSSSLIFTSCGLRENYIDPQSFQYRKEDYREIDLIPLTSNNTLRGFKPEEIALKTFGLSQNPSSEATSKETINTVRDRQSNFVVSITQTELLDDSVKGIRYLIEFEPHDNSLSNPQWQMTWAGQQFICQPGRGEQDWTKSYCY